MKTYKYIKCTRCNGSGLVLLYVWSDLPDECPDCCGAGSVLLYNSGVLAKYYGGPLLGKMKKEPKNAI